MTGLLVDTAGWAGAACLLLAYGLVSTGRLNGRSVGFQLLNLSGAVGLLVNGVWHGAWPSAALNGIWLVIGAQALTRLRRTEPVHPSQQLHGPPPTRQDGERTEQEQQPSSGSHDLRQRGHQTRPLQQQQSPKETS